MNVSDNMDGFTSVTCNGCSFADSHCDEGYLLYGDHCYHFESESVKTWQEAESYCVAQNGHLVSIHNQEIISFLTGETAGFVFYK